MCIHLDPILTVDRQTDVQTHVITYLLTYWYNDIALCMSVMLTRYKNVKKFLRLCHFPAQTCFR